MVRDLKIKETSRGFARIDFKDQYGIGCSLQKSSLATEDCIWLGCNEANPKVLIPGIGWQPIEMPDGYIADTRMHLTQEMAKELIKHLQTFVDTGDLWCDRDDDLMCDPNQEN